MFLNSSKGCFLFKWPVRSKSTTSRSVELELLDTVGVESVYATEVDTDAIDADVPRYCVDFTDV